MPGIPSLIAINHDDYHASGIGHTQDGRQFFLTTPFVPALGGEPGREFLALYLFNDVGDFLEAKIDDLGTRAQLDKDRARELYAQRIKELGPVTNSRIEIAPFQVERFGITFGLIPREPENEDDPIWVELHPGNCMAFHEPWDSGDYDT
jgi:hypothetical protein